MWGTAAKECLRNLRVSLTERRGRNGCWDRLIHGLLKTAGHPAAESRCAKQITQEELLRSGGEQDKGNAKILTYACSERARCLPAFHQMHAVKQGGCIGRER